MLRRWRLSYPLRRWRHATSRRRPSEPPDVSDGEAGAAAAGGGRVGIVDAEGGAHQVVDEIDLRASQERHRSRIAQHHGRVALDHQVVLGLGALNVELVKEAGA